MAGMYVLTTANQAPPGYNLTYIIDGITSGQSYGVYELYDPTDISTSDSVRGPGQGVGAYVHPDDVGITNILGGAAGYTTLITSSLIDDYFDYFLHDPSAVAHNPVTGTDQPEKKTTTWAYDPSPAPANLFWYPGADSRLTSYGASPFTFGTGAPVPPAYVVAGTLAATPADSAVSLSWGAGTQHAVTGSPVYKLWRTTSPSASPLTGTLVSGPNTSLTFSDTGLTNGTTYRYQVECGIDLSTSLGGSATFIVDSGFTGTFSTANRSNIVSATPSVSSAVLPREFWGAILVA